MRDQSEALLRRIRVQTANGALEGLLRSSAILRLLDDLNVARQFITLEDAEILAGDWPPNDGPLAIRRESVLFVVELSEPPPRPGRGARPSEDVHYRRAPVVLRVGDFSIEGSVHVLGNGTAMARLQQQGHTFVALTAASVVGASFRFETPFLAVNRRHVTAVRERNAAEDVAAATG